MKNSPHLLTIALLCIAALVSCKKEPLDGLTFDQSFLYLVVGKTATLTVTFIPADATNKKVSWESSDPNIATVDKGVVTAIAVGQATITVISQDHNRRAQCVVYVIQPIEPEMVWVEGGTFTMGCTDEQGEDCRDNELPAHQVTVSGFYIGKYEVTQKEWKALTAIDLCPSHLNEDFPVHYYASWSDVQDYINRLNAYTGKNYRLPTEAEWEYAARGGTHSQGYKYSGSNFVNEVSGDVVPCPVGGGKPNELGIYDMSGNVFELCSDWYAEYTANPQINPPGPSRGELHVIRGGYGVRVSYRRALLHNEIYFGFRLVMPAESNEQ